MATSFAVLYWLFDDRCVCLWRHGYIGVTVDWPHRLYRHRSESNFLPSFFKGQVLFRGPVQHCLRLERKLRPTAGIGWNKYPGGRSGHAAKGVPKSPETRAKMRAAALSRYADPAERERTSKAVKRTRHLVDQTGVNNPRFGVPMSEATKEKVRQRIQERGGLLGVSNPNWRGGKA
jgi:hypothetical protein